MGNRLFVGNLPFTATEAEVRALCTEGGREVTSVKIVTDRETGQSRGFAFVDFESDEVAKQAIAALDGRDLGGRALKVNEAQERAAGGRPFGGQKFGGGGGNFRTQGESGFGSRGPQHEVKRGSQRGGGRGGSRGS
jgi:RNA recognition motif-containing protein